MAVQLVPTIRVRTEAGHVCVINESDFDSSKHTKLVENEKKETPGAARERAKMGTEGNGNA